MESQRLLIILLVLTVLVGYGWSQGNPPPRSISDVNVFCNKFLILVGVVRLFLGEENITIANFSMIPASSFHDIDTNDDRQNDGVWCQSSLNRSMIGTWYYPNGTEVPLGSGSPLFADNTQIGQIGLLRNQGISSIQGLYRCVIPNEEGVNQTLYVAAYGSGNDGEFGLTGMFLLL